MVHEHPTGDICRDCDCELVLVVTQDEANLYLECECGTVVALSPERVRQLLAAQTAAFSARSA